jgi:hypothetical protein
MSLERPAFVQQDKAGVQNTLVGEKHGCLSSTRRANQRGDFLTEA